jgi:hypothetical protein
MTDDEMLDQPLTKRDLLIALTTLAFVPGRSDATRSRNWYPSTVDRVREKLLESARGTANPADQP